MKGDFSKWYADPNDNYNGVLHQQGRVLLDSDWNAQTQILNDWQTIAGQDIIGAGVAAVPAENPDAFKVIQAKVCNNPDRVELQIQPGHIWADGLLVNLAGPDTLTLQAKYLQPPIQSSPGTVGSIKKDVRDAVILEVWQEAFNGFQKPETLIEPALGGPDTTERLQTAMAWRLYRLADDENCDNIRDKLHGNKGTLTVSLQDPSTTNEDCPVVSAGGYTGFEHYLYRVEIAHTKDTPKFKWSQFNGGLVGRGVFPQAPAFGQPGKVIITHNLQAIIHAGIGDFYLEVIEYDAALGNQQVIYGATASLNNSHELELATTVTFGTQPVSPVPEPGKLPKTYFFRLWNGIADIAPFVDPAKVLQDGILLKFDNPTSPDKTYTPGDYWTFKVRAGEIPNVSPLINKQPPEGIVYHRVAVAELNWNAAKNISFDKQEIEDCRQPFRPLTNQKGCCTFSVGDGKRSQGDFNSIEDAIHHLPPNGGKICVLPGIHTANVEIFNRCDIQITGCGLHSIVHPRAETATAPIFHIIASQNIQLDDMTLVTVTGTAIQLRDKPDGVITIAAFPQDTNVQDSRSIYILGNRIVASTYAIDLQVDNDRAGDNDIWIAYNQIALLDKPEGKAAIFSVADGVLIERNRIVIVPAPQRGAPRPPGDDGSNGVFDPCKDPKSHYTARFPNYLFVHQIFVYVANVVISKPLAYSALGGIQIGVTSDRVRILNNEIIGGNGHGITLGHLPPELVDIPFINPVLISELTGQQIESLRLHPEFLNAIAIEGNHIQRMGLSGISVAAFTHLEIGWMVRVDDLTIYRNVITHCAQQLPSEIPSNLIAQVAFGGIALADAEDVTIQENRIEANGIDHTHPVCGIFISLGEKIDISNNRILSNGSRISEQSGVRGGVVIAMSFKSLVNILAGGEQFLSPDGIPAVKIHDNIITQPLGHALFLIAFGPVSVVSNHLTSQSVDKKNPFSLLAGAVFILNLGVSKDLMTLFFLASLSQLAKMSAANITAPQADLRKILYLPDGMVLFTNNQVTLDLRLDDLTIIFSSQFIISLDDVAYNSNQAECNSFSNPKLNQQNIPTDIVLTDVAIVGVTVRSNDNRFQEGFTFSPASLFSLGMMNTGTGNQATHCLHILGVPLWTVDNDNLVLFDGKQCSGTTQLLRRIFGIS